MIAGIPVTTLSASALLGITVMLILTGMLVPRRVIKDKTAEAERWQKAYETEREARGLADEQTRELLEVAHTTQAIISAMAKTSREIREESSDAEPGS